MHTIRLYTTALFIVLVITIMGVFVRYSYSEPALVGAFAMTMTAAAFLGTGWYLADSLQHTIGYATVTAGAMLLILLATLCGPAVSQRFSSVVIETAVESFIWFLAAAGLHLLWHQPKSP